MLIEELINQNNNAPENNNLNNQETNQPVISNTLLTILQIENKYEYISKIQELKREIDRYIKLVSETINNSNNDNKNNIKQDSKNIELLTKISMIIDNIIDILKFLPPDEIKLIYNNLLNLVDKLIPADKK